MPRLSNLTTTRRAVLRHAALLPAVALTAPARAALAGEEKEKKKGGGLSYIQLAPLNVSMNQVMGRRGILSVECGLDATDGGLHARAAAAQLILRDAYLRWLAIYAAALPPQAPPNPDIIQKQMQRETDRVMGRPGVRFIIGTVMIT